MSVNRLSTKLRLSVGSSHNDTLVNKEHPETAAPLTSSDIEWQWTSPVGTVTNVKVIRADKTPIGLQQVKTPLKSISPVSNDFPRKRKLIKIEENVTEVGANNANACEGDLQCLKEDYCALFDDGEDAMDECLVQLSQTVEKNLSQNTKGIVPLEATTPRRTTRVHSVVTKTNVFSLNPSKVAIKQCIENDFPLVETTVGGSTPRSSSSSLPPLLQGVLRSENITKYEINDSFDDILVTFCEENVELLSQPTNQNFTLNIPNLQTSARTSPELSTVSTLPPLNIPTLQSSSKRAITKAPATTRPTLSTRPVPQQGAIKSSNSMSLTVPKHEELNCDKTLDDDFLQPDLLKLLESVEANSQPQPASQTLHCTPEEIELKRRQAKMKLERKKIALKSGLVRI